MTGAARWDGTHWAPSVESYTTVPVEAQFEGISCPSVTFCAAVGGTQTGQPGLETDTAPLIALWNGSRWTIAQSSAPAGSLTSVSCSSPTFCVAIGWAVQGPLAEIWNGTRWTTQNPQDSAASLTAVSCTSATFCIVVGAVADKAVAERWDGAGWSAQPIPTPASTSASNLGGISCTSPTACEAIGAADFRALTENWDGEAWTIQADPTSWSDGRTLQAIFCTAPIACVTTASRGSTFTAGVWNGSAWSDAGVQRPTGDIGSVWCESTSACVGVGSVVRPGDTSASPLTGRWNGTTWTLQYPPHPNYYRTDFALKSVSCTAAGSCVAVGDGSRYEHGSYIWLPLIERSSQ